MQIRIIMDEEFPARVSPADLSMVRIGTVGVAGVYDCGIETDLGVLVSLGKNRYRNMPYWMRRYITVNRWVGE